MKYSEQLRDQLTAAGKLPDCWDAAYKMAQKRRDAEDVKDYQKILEILIREKITPQVLFALYGSDWLKSLFGEIRFLKLQSFDVNKYFYFKRSDIYINAIIVRDSRSEKIVEEYYELVRMIEVTKIVFKPIETVE